MRRVGLCMLTAGRLNPLEIFGGHEVQDRKGFEAMLAKAAQIEQRKAAQPKD